jgi:hypothetical protein
MSQWVPLPPCGSDDSAEVVWSWSVEGSATGEV